MVPAHLDARLFDDVDDLMRQVFDGRFKPRDLARLRDLLTQLAEALADRDEEQIGLAIESIHDFLAQQRVEQPRLGRWRGSDAQPQRATVQIDSETREALGRVAAALRDVRGDKPLPQDGGSVITTPAPSSTFGDAASDPTDGAESHDKARLTSPPFTPQPTPAREPAESDWVNEEERKLGKGLIMFNPPDEMALGTAATVIARIARSLAVELTKDAKGTGEPQIAEISVSSAMTVGLMGPHFQIIPSNPDQTTQYVTMDEFTEWEWDVTPLRSGTQLLILTVSVVIERPGHPDRRKYRKVFEKRITVRVNRRYAVYNFLANHWQWVVTTLLTLLAISFSVILKLLFK